jgi:predicted Zn-dependent protease
VALDKDGNKTSILTPGEEWTAAKDELALGNSKALNAFNGVDKNMFRMIKQCTVAKDAWDILKIAHEGTTKVKSARLQLLTTKFENLRTMEDESIQDYHLNILDIANSLTLFEKTSLMRSLLEKFSDPYLIDLI